ncbi:hypothetical protein HNQ94_000125 [Salirhabdus euzebyi]|uniref:Uncharacterized protein n=1 Tax=Salirhabdus euzebyi TaxID=394506 RepID=A0A841PVF6_9BACI|nr:hypothetical protein [Salirhabdus euzebyi]MBB6451704.1 hypothetical protein [Salirhabdus euzebyi]
MKEIKINESVNFLDDTIAFDYIEVGTTENRLFFRYEPKKDKLADMMNVTIRTDKEKGWERDFVIEQAEEGTYFITTPPFHEWPSKLNIQLNSVRLVGENDFSFTIDASKYDEVVNGEDAGHTEKPEEKLATIKNTDVYLDELVYDESGIYFMIRYELPQNEKRPYVQLASRSPEIYEIYKEIIEETDRDPHEKGMLERHFGNLVQAVNEKGEEGSYGSRGGGPGSRYGLLLEREFVEDSEEINVTIHKLFYEVVLHWEKTIDVHESEH